MSPRAVEAFNFTKQLSSVKRMIKLILRGNLYEEGHTRGTHFSVQMCIIFHRCLGCKVVLRIRTPSVSTEKRHGLAHSLWRYQLLLRTQRSNASVLRAECEKEVF